MRETTRPIESWVRLQALTRTRRASRTGRAMIGQVVVDAAAAAADAADTMLTSQQLRRRQTRVAGAAACRASMPIPAAGTTGSRQRGAMRRMMAMAPQSAIADWRRPRLNRMDSGHYCCSDDSTTSEPNWRIARSRLIPRSHAPVGSKLRALLRARACCHWYCAAAAGADAAAEAQQRGDETCCLRDPVRRWHVHLPRPTRDPRPALRVDRYRTMQMTMRRMSQCCCDE
jgi:hypothetical protein